MREFPSRLDLPEEVVEIASTLEQAGHETWVVGGTLRDRLLGLPHAEVDLATAATPDVVQGRFRHTVAVGVRFGTVGVLDPRGRLHEVTTFRRDVETDGRHAVVTFGVSLAEDLSRRDFTINAIAYHPLRQEWADPFDGLADLRRGVVRAVGRPADRFREDYLRILRALRFAARFGFTIDPATWAAAVAAAPGLTGLSAERVRDEWVKGLATARSIPHLATLWRDVGAAAIWLPELRPGDPGGDPAPEVRDPVVLTAWLCARPAAVFARLRGSNTDVGRARALAAGPSRPASAAAADVRRWLAAVGPAAEDLLLLERYRTGAEPAWQAIVDGIRARGEATRREALALGGADLLAAGVPAGPAVGEALAHLLTLVLENPAMNTRERLLEALRAWR